MAKSLFPIPSPCSAASGQRPGFESPNNEATGKFFGYSCTRGDYLKEVVGHRRLCITLERFRPRLAPRGICVPWQGRAYEVDQLVQQFETEQAKHQLALTSLSKAEHRLKMAREDVHAMDTLERQLNADKAKLLSALDLVQRQVEEQADRKARALAGWSKSTQTRKDVEDLVAPLRGVNRARQLILQANERRAMAKREAEEAAARQKAEEEARREAEDAKRKEAARQKAEEEAAEKAAAEARRKAEEEEAALRAAEERKRKEDDALREAAARKAEEEKNSAMKAAAEARRKAEDEEAALRAAEERKRKEDDALREAAARKAEEEKEAALKGEEEARRKDEENTRSEKASIGKGADSSDSDARRKLLERRRRKPASRKNSVEETAPGPMNEVDTSTDPARKAAPKKAKAKAKRVAEAKTTNTRVQVGGMQITV
eukprot:TRINITY_DN8641_c0_g1_i2.p1 TRINITY_DN8641_c0_g1~~TRINITY_DN8641_c0_g1_i2.p1  ORF type:complete len:443 (-),score=90.46 TRINITY_DN8641_c0_g1_i2:80-1375(-)